MKKYLRACIVFFLFAARLSAQTADEQAIRNAMDLQLTAWNAHDIEKFMGTYWNNDSVMFIGKSGITYGWQNTLNNYRRSYPDTASMGKLDFHILHVNRLSDQYYFVVGKWHLSRSIGDLSGHFNLLFRKIKRKWVIIADHSS